MKASFFVLAVILLLTIAPATAKENLTTTPGSCTAYGGNPVFKQPSLYWIKEGVEREFVMLNGTNYVMLYSASDGNYWNIGLATSTDGITWKSLYDPVLVHGPPGSWDSTGVHTPRVLWNGSYYLMYFTGYNGTVYSRAIGLALSKDLVHWVKYAHNPVLAGEPMAYDSAGAAFASVIYDPPSYRMWYTGRYPPNYSNSSIRNQRAIDYANSTDGLHWMKYSGNPVIPSFSTSPAVIKLSSTFLMVLANGVFTYAVSSDGTHWDVAGYPLITLSNSSSLSWDNGGHDFPSILLNGTKLLFYYTGYAAGSPLPLPPPAIGLAFCNFILVSSTKTTTKTTTTTNSYTLTRTTTATSSETTTITGTAESLPQELGYYQVASAALGVALAGAVVSIMLMKRRIG